MDCFFSDLELSLLDARRHHCSRSSNTVSLRVYSRPFVVELNSDAVPERSPVITGVGIVSAAGIGVEEVFKEKSKVGCLNLKVTEWFD